MSEIRLFERMRRPGDDYKQSDKSDIKKTTESIINHLQKLLNSKQGTTLMDSNYGMPDFSEMTSKFPGSVRVFERAISETIEKYESRLSEVDVTFIFQEANTLSLVFEINAMIRINRKLKSINMESYVNSSGQMIING